MLNLNIAVAPGSHAERVARSQALHAAHIKQLHLARPFKATITPITNSMHALARAMGLAVEDHEYYRVECETVPCLAT